MKRRLAQHAVDLSLAFEPLEHMEQFIHPEQREQAKAFRRGGEGMATVMLMSAHGDMTSGTDLPSTATLNGWRRGANAQLKQLSQVDPGFLERYLATLSPEDQRTVRSMLIGPGG